MSDKKIVHIDGEDGAIGFTAAMLKTELQELMDKYAGAINNAEAIGVLQLQMMDIYQQHLEADDG